MRLTLICALLLALSGISFAEDAPQPGKQVSQKLVSATDQQAIHYLLYLPKDYAAKKDWPVIVFLHGSGERGDGNLDVVAVHGPPKIAEKKELPFIVVSPQCPKDTRWSDETQLARLDELITHVTKNLTADHSRVYLTGLSMGGSGTWSLAAKWPQRFAAIAPMCGRGDLEAVETLKLIPTWVFIGGEDRKETVENCQQMVEALKAKGGDATLKFYPDLGHDCWTVSYDNPDFYEWLLKHQRKQP